MANVKLVYINSTGGYVESTGTADVAQSLGKLELTGVGGVALDAGAAKLSNLGTPTSSGDAATKGYVDALAGGASWVAPVLAVATSNVTLSGFATIDGVACGDGARVLITGQNGSTPDSANGIYIVSTIGAWTRAADVLQDGTAMFVQEGTVYANTQYVLTTDGAITPGTTPIIFQQFGATIAYTAGNGLVLTGTSFAVDLATNSGLEFDSGKLRIDVASADQLALDGSGLNVVGVPTQFKIGSTAVSTNVTAANLTALTGDVYTALHLHANVGFSAIFANANFTSGQVAYYNFSNAGLELANANSAATSGVIGVANGAVSTGTFTGRFITQGAFAGFSGLTAGTAYFLSDTTAGNLITYASLTSGSRAIRIGYALAADAIAINIQDMGVKP
jgi:hypothetical protein